MSLKHDAAHEAVLQRWVVREELSAEERGLLAGCEECRQRRSEIEAVTAELEELGAAEREAEIEEARRSTAPEWEDRALSTLERNMRGDGRTRTWWSAPRLAIGLAAAAAVVALLYFVPRTGSGPEPPEPFYLEPTGIDAMSPAGRVERIVEFTWEHRTSDLGSYEIDLYLPGESTPFHTATTYETRWTPDLPDPLPEHFLWEVRALEDGQQVAFGHEEVFVSPP